MRKLDSKEVGGLDLNTAEHCILLVRELVTQRCASLECEALDERITLYGKLSC